MILTQVSGTTPDGASVASYLEQPVERWQADLGAQSLERWPIRRWNFTVIIGKYRICKPTPPQWRREPQRKEKY